MKPVSISAPASEELREAVRWAEERRPGWGARLFDAVTHTFELAFVLPASEPPPSSDWIPVLHRVPSARARRLHRRARAHQQTSGLLEEPTLNEPA